MNACSRSSFLSLIAFAASASLARADESPARTASVHIRDLTFDPKVLHVKAGTTVVWTNDDDVVHTVTSGTTSDDGAWVSSPEIAGGKTFSHTFAKVGSYAYFCKPHFYNENMHGQVIVEE
jgi:plastocyanin